MSVSAQMSYEKKILQLFSLQIVSGYYTVKQHKLDAVISVNLICFKLEQQAAGIIAAWILCVDCCFAHWLLGIMQLFLYCSQHTKLLLCESEELFAQWALLFCSSLTQSKTKPKPTVHGVQKQTLNCLDSVAWQMFWCMIITSVCFCIDACLKTAGRAANCWWCQQSNAHCGLKHVPMFHQNVFMLLCEKYANLMRKLGGQPCFWGVWGQFSFSSVFFFFMKRCCEAKTFSKFSSNLIKKPMLLLSQYKIKRQRARKQT